MAHGMDGASSNLDNEWIMRKGLWCSWIPKFIGWKSLQVETGSWLNFRGMNQRPVNEIAGVARCHREEK
jgi:hypothetical protein